MAKSLMTDLIEAGFTVNTGYFRFLDEATQAKIADNALMDMFKFITDKYNTIDFGEIEKTGGDYRKFKYRQLIDENLNTLMKVYNSSSDPGAKAFMDDIMAIRTAQTLLDDKREQFIYLYRSKDGITQILYTSLVSAIVYATSALVANTIRFVTLDDDNDIQVIYNETNNAARNIHIKNIRSAHNSNESIRTYLDTAFKYKKSNLSESVSIASIAAGALAVIVIVPRIIPFIRECIYAVYFTRVKLSQAIELQIYLVKTNIESLEATGRSSKTVIAKQKAVVGALLKVLNIISVRMDDAESMTNRRIREENTKLKIDKTDPIATTGEDALLL